MKLLTDKLKIFLLSNQFVRAIRLFTNQKLRPFLLKSVAIITVVAIIAVIILQLVKPEYLKKIHQRISFKIARYIHFDSREFNKIEVYGNNRTSTDQILDVVKKVKNSSDDISVNGSYEPLIQKITIEIKKQLPWINQVTVIRNIPDILAITVTEYEPFAIWEHEGNKYVTDKDGNIVLVDDVTEFENLVIISGDEANLHVNSLFNIFAIDPKLSSEVYSATWLGGRRWDIRLNSGLLIKLPESDIGDAWNKLIKIYNMQGSLNSLKVIDLRIDGNIYLEYGDSVIKEIQSL
ncbi:MAG: cell division protein FtsQ/DivIB [Rickettsiales bacterium]|nr:cell division protein FtsQ/DivIB [Rickettsiales bacterium]